MRIELIHQPDATSDNLYSFVADALASTWANRFVAVTAWANFRGLARLVPGLRAFRGRPTSGIADIILGIDEGGATEQGLRLAAAEFDHSYVFSSSDERTFHPKVYFVTGASHARLLIGSNNLTPGGLFFNFEAALAMELDPTASGPPEDQALVTSVQDWIARLIADTDVCKSLPPNLEAIVVDPRFGVRDEAAPRARSAQRPSDPDADHDLTSGRPIFGRSHVPLRPNVAPGMPIPRSNGVAVSGGVGPGRPPARTMPSGRVTGAPRPVSPPVSLRRWFRPLDATAAQRPPSPGSSPTGNIRLTQAGHGIDQTSYFRTELFGSAAWTGVPEARGLRETAAVDMEVVIDGRSLGARRFTVSHAAWREAGQGNVTTVLHTGAIADELRDSDYSGRVLTLEELKAGEFRLTIDTSETGPFRR
jgi:hypothetical protein